MADDLFESPSLLIHRAREHIDDLEANFKRFFERKPYAHVIDLDRKNSQNVYKVRLTAKMPGRCRAVLKDVTSNLWDALDHAIYAAAAALGSGDPEKTGFPFANDATHLQGELRSWKFSDVPTEIHPQLMGFRPYPTGNDLLVALNRIRNPNTHRVLVPVGFATTGLDMKFKGALLLGDNRIGYSDWDPAKNEVEYMRLGSASPNPDFEVKIAFDVTFGDAEFVRGKPAVSTFREIASEVERVVLAIEAETRRILASP